MCPGARSSRGFTLIELMIVMVLMTMVTSFAIPALRSNLYSDQLKSTARKLMGLVSEVSQDAVSSQSVYLLHFDLDGNRVWKSAEKVDTSGIEPRQQKELNIPDTVRVVDIASAHGGKRSEGTPEIRFTAKGYVDKTLIHLRAEDGREMTLMLSPFIAVTRIKDSYIELDDQKTVF